VNEGQTEDASSENSWKGRSNKVFKYVGPHPVVTDAQRTQGAEHNDSALAENSYFSLPDSAGVM